MKPVACDTGPILHLQEAGLLELLKKAGDIYIPAVVDIELMELYPQWENKRPDWLLVKPLSPAETSQSELLSASGLLDLGEAAAIILSKRLNATWLLTDDTETSLWISKAILSQAYKALDTIFEKDKK